MDNSMEQSPRPMPEAGKNWSAIGFGIFRDVSRESPGSTNAQAIGVAAKCILENYDPAILRDALLSDPERIATLADIAVRTHKATEAKKTNKDKLKRLLANRQKTAANCEYSESS